MLCKVKANVCIILTRCFLYAVNLYNIKLFSMGLIVKQKVLASLNLQELYRVLEAGLEPAQPLLAKGF